MRKNSKAALLSCLVTLLSSSAFAYEASRTCQAKDGKGKNYDYLKITSEKTNLKDLFINGYQVVSASQPLKDSDGDDLTHVSSVELTCE